MSTLIISRFARVPGSDENIIIPTPPLGINDHHYDAFSAPDLNNSSDATPPILFFKLEVRDANANLQVAINQVEVVNKQDLPIAKARSFHEFISQGVLRETDNLVDVINFNSEGSIVISDIFILYQAKFQSDILDIP